MERCIEPGCKRPAAPGSNYCFRHDMDGKGVVYLKKIEDEKISSNDAPDI